MDDLAGPGAGAPPPGEEPRRETAPARTEHPEHPAGVRRVKRRLMFGLIGLYVLSIAAAGVLLSRRVPAASAKKGAAGRPEGMGLLGLSENTQAVGWISIHGTISSSASGKPWEKGVEQWERKLKIMAADPNVKAIVLDINSPGGSVGAVQELYSQILRVRKEHGKPVVALFGDVAASGGYYIASACDRIVAHPGSLTGSIGVIFEVTNLQGLFNKIGFKMDPIKSGKHKDIGSPARPMTPEERALLQAVINDAYGQFVQAVADGRHIPVDEVKKLADGRVFSGTQALENHLVDKLGDSTDAVELAAQLGHISGKPKIKRDTERFGDIFDLLDSRIQDALIPRGASQLVDRLTEQDHHGLEYRWEGW